MLRSFKFLSSEEYQKSKRIAIYLSMPDEINTEEIMHVSLLSLCLAHVQYVYIIF